MLRPGLSMLWESSDAARELPERFGLDDLDTAGQWLAGVLAEHWGLRTTALTRLTLSDHNAIAWVSSDRGPVAVKFSAAAEHFARLAGTTQLLTHLATHGLPVAAPLPTRDGSTRVVADGPAGQLSLAVLPEVEGDWLDVADLRAVHAVGACLASLHHALGDVDPGDAPRPLRTRLAGWLDERDPGRAPAASARLAALLEGLPELEDSPQLIHGDYRAANLLMRDGTVAAVLDLDEARADHRIADLAQAGTYLATLFRDWGPTPAPAREALRAGYESVRRLSPAESAWLEALTLWMGIAAIPPGDDGRWSAAVPGPAAASSVV